MRLLRIAFLGSDPIALPLLDHLRANSTVMLVGVLTQPDRPSGRGQRLLANEIKQWALEHSLPVEQPVKLDSAACATLSAWAPDLSLVMAYGHILRSRFIEIPRLGTLNLHASLLPRYRGASPIQSAVSSGERETGLSLMRIVPELDAGPVADRERVPIDSLDTALDVEAKLATACVPLMRRNLSRLAANDLDFAPQDHGRATFCRRLAKEDGGIDFTHSAGDLAARINGLFPWPGCRTRFQGEWIKLGLADAVEGQEEPGVVAGVDPQGLLLGTGQGRLRLRMLQRSGGRMLPADAFLRGFTVGLGQRFDSEPMPPLVSARPFRS